MGGERLEAFVEVTKSHGAFYTDGESVPSIPADQLSSLAFFSSEASLVYTAEANAPEDNTDDIFSIQVPIFARLRRAIRGTQAPNALRSAMGTKRRGTRRKRNNALHARHTNRARDVQRLHLLRSSAIRGG